VTERGLSAGGVANSCFTPNEVASPEQLIAGQEVDLVDTGWQGTPVIFHESARGACPCRISDPAAK
jgi:hypothetical protein